jgi:predicted transcriptional regulator
MSLVVHLSEELSRRVEEIAAERNQSPEQVAVEAIEAQLPARRRLKFIGMGHSGQPEGSENLKELRREAVIGRLAGLDHSAEG